MAILSHWYKFFMDFTYCICKRSLSLFFVQVVNHPLGRHLMEHHFDSNSCGEGQATPPHQLRVWWVLWAPPVGFGVESQPSEGFPLFSALRTVSPDTMGYHAAIGDKTPCYPPPPHTRTPLLQTARFTDVFNNLYTAKCPLYWELTKSVTSIF